MPMLDAAILDLIEHASDDTDRFARLQALYAENEASREHRASQRADRAAARAGYRAPETKPDTRARRLIRALGDIDAM